MEEEEVEIKKELAGCRIECRDGRCRTLCSYEVFEVMEYIGGTRELFRESEVKVEEEFRADSFQDCLLYTSPSPRDRG